ncbi:MAG: GFA family protein [Myxococcaceae bacterium]|nr:GFA family protein [Myxococcaceae bacterium]
MATKTYRGSCHCKRITFEADVDLSKGTGKCNCTSCWKKRFWSVRCDPQGFRPLTGAEHLSNYKHDDPMSHSGFCKHCGVITYGRVAKSDWNPAEYVTISVASLDDLDPAELAAAPVQYYDGRNDAWQNKPAEVRHL